MSGFTIYWSNAEGKEGEAWQGPESKVKGRSAPLARTDQKVRQAGSGFAIWAAASI